MAFGTSERSVLHSRFRTVHKCLRTPLHPKEKNITFPEGLPSCPPPEIYLGAILPPEFLTSGDNSIFFVKEKKKNKEKGIKPYVQIFSHSAAEDAIVSHLLRQVVDTMVAKQPQQNG